MYERVALLPKYRCKAEKVWQPQGEVWQRRLSSAALAAAQSSFWIVTGATIDGRFPHVFQSLLGALVSTGCVERYLFSGPPNSPSTSCRPYTSKAEHVRKTLAVISGIPRPAPVPPSACIPVPPSWSDLIVARVYACVVGQGGGMDGQETETE